MSLSTEQLVAPGIYPSMPYAEYVAIPAANASLLVAMNGASPRKAKHLKENPKETPALKLGIALHAAVLEPKKFDTDYLLGVSCQAILRSGPNAGERCTNQSRGQFFSDDGEYRWLCGDHSKGIKPIGSEKTLIGPKDYANICNAADEMLAHERAGEIIKDTPEADRELTIVWIDPHTGVLCKMRADILCRRRQLIADLKTTRDAWPAAFERQANQLCYDQKAAFYIDGARAAGIPISEFACFAIELQPTYDISIHIMDYGFLENARAENHLRLVQYAQAEIDGWESGLPSRPNLLTAARWNALRRERVIEEAE